MRTILFNCIFVLSALLFTSCGSVRVFEDKVPEPIKKNEIHKDAEKQGAYILAADAKNENKNIANALSRSLGTPSKIETDKDKVTLDLLALTSAYEARINGLNTKLESIQGKDIQGTGFNLLPSFSILGIVAIGALLILFPSAITILFFILKRTRSAFANVVKGVQEFSQKNPEQSEDLNSILEKKMDRQEKVLKTKFESYG